MKSRGEIKRWAWQSVRQNYWPTIGVYLLFYILTIVLAQVPGVGWLLSMLVGTIITVGSAMFFLMRYRQQRADAGTLFQPFNRYGRVLGGMLWQYLWIFLWSLLFIIPGIVKSYSYFCTKYILADSPNVEATRALDMSKKMMDGRKANVFIAHLSFIGWALLAVAIYLVFLIPAGIFAGAYHYVAEYNYWTSMGTFGMAGFVGGMAIVGLLAVYAYLVLFLGPYVEMTMAGFYEEIKKDAIARGVVTPQEFDMPDYGYEQMQSQRQQMYNQPPYGQQQPPYGQNQQPPYGYNQQQPPYAQNQQQPQYGQGQQQPPYGQGQQPPPYGQNQQQRSSGQDGQSGVDQPPQDKKPPFDGPEQI